MIDSKGGPRWAYGRASRQSWPRGSVKMRIPVLNSRGKMKTLKILSPEYEEVVVLSGRAHETPLRASRKKSKSSPAANIAASSSLRGVLFSCIHDAINHELCMVSTRNGPPPFILNCCTLCITSSRSYEYLYFIYPTDSCGCTLTASWNSLASSFFVVKCPFNMKGEVEACRSGQRRWGRGSIL